MAVYIGTLEDADERAVGAERSGRSLRNMRSWLEGLVDVHTLEAVEGRTISVEDRIAEHERLLKEPLVTATSDYFFVGSDGKIDYSAMRPKVIQPQPRSVRTYDDASITRVRFGRASRSVATLVDDGDWNYHFEWSAWTPINEDD